MKYRRELVSIPSFARRVPDESKARVSEEAPAGKVDAEARDGEGREPEKGACGAPAPGPSAGALEDDQARPDRREEGRRGGEVDRQHGEEGQAEDDSQEGRRDGGGHGSAR